MLLTARVLGKVPIQTPHEALVTKAVRLLFFELPLSVLLNICEYSKLNSNYYYFKEAIMYRTHVSLKHLIGI